MGAKNSIICLTTFTLILYIIFLFMFIQNTTYNTYTKSDSGKMRNNAKNGKVEKIMKEVTTEHTNVLIKVWFILLTF